MDLHSLSKRIAALATRTRPRNPVVMTTTEMRARLADLLGLSEDGLASLASECRAAGISMSDFLRAAYGGMVQP